MRRIRPRINKGAGRPKASRPIVVRIRDVKSRIPNPESPQKITLIAHCIARGPPCAITGLPASTSGVDWIVPNNPLRTLDEVFAGKPRFTRLEQVEDLPARLDARVPREVNLLDDVHVPLCQARTAHAVSSARAERAGSRCPECLREVGDEPVGVGEVVDRIREAVRAKRSGVLPRLVAAAHVRRERPAAERREYRGDLPAARERAAAGKRVDAGNVEVVAPIEIARPAIRRRVVRVVGLREVVPAAAVVGVEVLTFRQRVVMRVLTPCQPCWRYDSCSASMPRLAVVGQLNDVAERRELRRERPKRLRIAERRAERRPVDVLEPRLPAAARSRCRSPSRRCP